MEPTKAISRRYNDIEVARILTRTAELQAASPTEAQPTHGLTQQELEQIAREVGLDPNHVQVAIAELETGQASQQSPWLGGPLWLRFERSILGELPESEFEPLVEIIQRTLKEVGQPSVLGRTLRWHVVTAASGHHGHGREIEVAITIRGGQTTVRVQERLRSLATNLFVGIIAGGGSTAGIFAGALTAAALGPAAAVGMGGAFVVGSYALARRLFRWRSGARSGQLRGLTDRLAEHVAGTVALLPALEHGAPRSSLGRGEA